MHALADARTWLQLGSGVVVALLGAFMLTVRPRLRANLAFALFAIAFGGYFIQRNAGTLFLDDGSADPPLLNAAAYALTLLGALGGLVWVAVVFPAPLERGERRYILLPLAAGAVALVASTTFVISATSTVHGAAFVFAFIAMTASLGGLPAFYALRAARASSDVSQRQFAVLGSAFALYGGFITTAGGTATREGSALDPIVGVGLTLASVAPLLIASVLWLRAAARIEASRAARNTALLCAAMPLFGLVYVALDMNWGVLGIVRIAMVAVLAYGIARHQLLGLDLKVRWTISKSTIAAVFIAVFFVASEAAQQFFGESLGSAYVGIAAAGMLVFAIAPLQRAAERLAEKAVPVTAPPAPAAAPAAAVSPVAPSSAALAYKAALRAAMRDGAVTRREERHLAEVARALGVDPVQAHAWRDEVEREAGDGRAEVA